MMQDSSIGLSGHRLSRWCGERFLSKLWIVLRVTLSIIALDTHTKDDNELV